MSLTTKIDVASGLIACARMTITALQAEDSVVFTAVSDARDDIKLFVKLPRWFVVDTPVGGYNPDWAILKDDGQATLYLVRETKSTMDFTKLRTLEADKVNCGKRHFEAIGVPFSVVVTAQQV